MIAYLRAVTGNLAVAIAMVTIYAAVCTAEEPRFRIAVTLNETTMPMTADGTNFDVNLNYPSQYDAFLNEAIFDGMMPYGGIMFSEAGKPVVTNYVFVPTTRPDMYFDGQKFPFLGWSRGKAWTSGAPLGITAQVRAFKGLRFSMGYQSGRTDHLQVTDLMDYVNVGIAELLERSGGWDIWRLSLSTEQSVIDQTVTMTTNRFDIGAEYAFSRSVPLIKRVTLAPGVGMELTRITHTTKWTNYIGVFEDFVPPTSGESGIIPLWNTQGELENRVHQVQGYASLAVDIEPHQYFGLRLQGRWYTHRNSDQFMSATNWQFLYHEAAPRTRSLNAQLVLRF